MRAGELNKRIELQYPTRVPDGMGGTSTVYVIAATVWAAIWPVSANEVVRANAPVMVVSHRIRIRYRSVMKASWRIQFGNRYFNIVSIINPNAEGRILDIMVKESA